MTQGPDSHDATTPGLAGFAAVVGLVLAPLGCVDTDPAVFVDTTIRAAQATVTAETLATTIDGSFALELHLGPRASDTAVVQLGAVSLTTADQAATLVDALAVTTSPSFPVNLPIDSTIDVGVGFAAADNLLEPAAYDTLCGAGTVTVSVALDDSLRGGTTTAVSSPFALAGCP